MPKSSALIPVPPKAILIVGGPGSGKTTISRSFLTENMLCIDPDAIREQLPEYDTLARSRVADLIERTKKATNRISDEIMEAAMVHSQSFVFVASGRDRHWYLLLIERLKEIGFEVTVVMVHTRPKVARTRCNERARINGRLVSDHYFEETHTIVPVNFIDFLQTADRFILLRNGGKTPEWTWYRASCGDIVRNGAHVLAYLECFAPEQAGLPGSIPANGELMIYDVWYREVRQKMEALPGWALDLETSYRLDE